MIVDSLDQQEYQQPEPVQSVRQDDFGPEMGWEFDFAAEHPLAYPVARTLADFAPLGWSLFPSGRRQFTESSTGGKILTLGLDAVGVFGPGLIGKGLKVAAKPITYSTGKLVKKLPFAMKNVAEQPKSVIDNLMRQLDEFVPTNPKQGLVSKYGLTDTEELEAVIRRQNFIPGKKPSEEFRSLFTKRGGELKSDVKKNIAKWAKPVEEQRLKWQRHQWTNVVKSVLNNPKYNLDDVLQGQAQRVFGPEFSKGITLKTLDSDNLDLLIKDALLNQGKILRGLDSKSWHYFAPTRKIFGAFNDRYGAYDNVYLKAVDANGQANLASHMYLGKFHAIMASKGLGHMTKSGVFKNQFLAEEWKKAGKIVVQLDKAQSLGAPTQTLQKILETGNARTQSIVKSWQEFTDYLYGDYLKTKIPQILDKLDLNDLGKLQIEKIFSATAKSKNISSYLTETLAGGNNLAYETKFKVINNSLKFLRGAIEKNPHWLNGYDTLSKTMSKEAQANVSRVLKELTLRQRGQTVGLPNYLDNYATRIFKEPPKTYGKVSMKTPTKMTAGFEKSRTLTEPVEELVEDLEEIVSIRLRSQAKTLYMYPKTEEILKFSRENLPTNLKNYTEHYINRLLGVASPIDKKVADVVNTTFGTSWNAEKVMKLAYSINDAIYLGGIGFKPFSAMRNYFQPLLTVPADLGGLRGIEWLAKGYKRATSKQFRNYMKEIGAITEYAPDLLFRPQVVSFNKSFKLLGKEIRLPSQSRIRDYAMWMFKQSDEHNRYIAGGAAFEKWEHYLSKFARKDSNGQTVLGGVYLDNFKKKLNLASREKWVRADIENALSAGNLAEAKKLWIKDVIADTQFLYGNLDAPLVNQVGGGITRTATVFQSWWMNYGSLLSKWITRSEDVPLAASRMFNWMLASAVGGTIMEQIWGASTARSTVFTGPLPLEPSLPPSWRPFSDALKTAIAAGNVPLNLGSMDEVRSRMKATINSSLMFIPGGLQMKETVPALLEGDQKEIIKSILRLR